MNPSLDDYRERPTGLVLTGVAAYLYVLEVACG
jgi:hypothetical protein